MGWFYVAISIIAAIIFFKSGHIILMIISIVAALGCFWSWGVMHNYATDIAKQRLGYTGKFYDINKEEANAIPNWITFINVLFASAGFILLIISIVLIL